MHHVSGPRASATGVPFMPVAGLDGSEIPALNGGSGCRPVRKRPLVFVVPAIRPQIAILHVNEIDEDGNARLLGSPQWDRSMSRGAARVLVTAERLVPRSRIEEQPELTVVPGFMVEAAAVVPRGAWPGSMYPDYGIDADAVEAYLEDGEDALAGHLESAPEARSRSGAR